MAAEYLPRKRARAHELLKLEPRPEPEARPARPRLPVYLTKLCKWGRCPRCLRAMTPWVIRSLPNMGRLKLMCSPHVGGGLAGRIAASAMVSARSHKHTCSICGSSCKYPGAKLVQSLKGTLSTSQERQPSKNMDSRSHAPKSGKIALGNCTKEKRRLAIADLAAAMPVPTESNQDAAAWLFRHSLAKRPKIALVAGTSAWKDSLS